MPRRGRFDVPQPILHPIASHATFDTAAAPAAPTPATAPAPQPPPPAPEQQPHGGKTKRSEPPPDQLSFSYLRSRKLEPYLPPPVDEHHPPPSLTLAHNFAQPPPPPPQLHHHHQHQHHAGAAGLQQASSPDSPPPSAHEEEEHHQQHHHHHEGDHSDHHHEEDEEQEEEEDLDWKPRPFITLTYAQSLDSSIATSPGARTALSGPATKAMTHFLRSRHDAILVGAGTASADDPGLNCRLEVEMSGGHQPRPVVVDPRARWDVRGDSKVVQLAREGRGLGPWVLCAEGVVPDPGRVEVLEGVGGRYIAVEGARRAGGDGNAEGGWKERKGKDKEGEGEEEEEDGSRPVLTWDSIFGLLWEEGINSVMVEGGATVINDLLLLANEGLDVVDSVIVTVAPVWLGAGGVTVAPERPVDAHMRRVPGPRLTDVMWSQMGDDMVLCGRIMR